MFFLTLCWVQNKPYKLRSYIFLRKIDKKLAGHQSIWRFFLLIIENYFGGLSAAPGPVEFHATFALGKDCNLDTWEILFSDCNLGLCSHVKVWRGPADYDVCSSKLMIESFLLNEPIHLRRIVYCSRTQQNMRCNLDSSPWLNSSIY